MSKILFIFAFLFACSVNLPAQPTNPLVIGRVSVNQTHIAFAHAGKIWLVERAGGAARPLDAAATDNNPVFSPDGRSIAFSRFNGGDFDLYVAPAAGGGEAKRLTFQSEDEFAAAWTPDGREIVFESTRDEEGVNRLFKVAADGSSALASALPLPQAFNGSFSPDGAKIAYNPRFPFGEWRYYRGGATAPIYITDLRTGAVEKLPNQNFNDRAPMWVGDKIYFISDRSGIFNLYVHDGKAKQAKQLTNFAAQGIRAAAATAGAIIFVQDGRLHLFDLNANQDRIVNVSVSPDTSALQPRTVSAMRFLESVLPSANGEKLTFGARGEVLLFDPASGESKNLTNTSGVAERYPSISPDGKTIAYFSDESGEYALHLRSLENNSVKKIQIEQTPSFYWDPIWSPDSKRLALADRRLNLWLADAAGGTVSKIDASVYSAQSGWQAGFSPDSRFLAYSKRLKNRAGAIFIHDVAQKKSFQVTDGVTHTESPAFDANGKYLYFVSSPNAGTSEFEWGVLNGTFARAGVVRRVHALILQAGAPSPLLPNNQPNADAKLSETASPVRIDFENLSRRFVDLPLPQRDYLQVIAGRPGKFFLVTNDWSETPGAEGGFPRNRSVYSYDLAKLGEMQKIVEKISSYDVTRDGVKLLYRKGADWFLVNADAAPKPDEGKLNLSKMEIRVEPQAEWRQMFHESMRIMRDWFYDPNHHGQNLKELENYYAAYLPTTTRRGDLNLLIRQMLGHVSVSHLGVGGGDTTPPGGSSGGGSSRTGLLGADYAVENGRVRFKKIYRSMPYSAANSSFNAPLDQPGVDVREGDYLLEVNGKRVETNRSLFSFFENTIGRPTKITVSSDPAGAGSRTFTVYPSAGENRLRRSYWAEENRRRVEQLSGGRLGYVFIEGYGGEGIMNAIRGLTGYADKQGIIIDQRFNGGGITPDYLIEWMQRKPLYYYMFRDGGDIPTPVNPAPPVKVMLINEWNGSAAETGAFMFKLARVGPMVGKRTYGAGIGPYFFTPRLIDGGQVQLPNRAAYDPSGSWGVENIGVAPDYDVEITPQDFMAGKDSQLEKAVEVALAEINKIKPQLPKRPAFPVHPLEKLTGISNSGSLPLPGSAFPIAQPKTETKPPAAAAAAASGKFALYVGEYNSPSASGLLVIKQEGDKLFAETGNDRLQLVPESEVDKFIAQPVGANVSFMRDAAGKVVGIKILLPNGREMEGKKVK